jgi:hypothetical protein
MHIGLNSAPRPDRGAQQILKDLRTREALLPDGSRLVRTSSAAAGGSGLLWDLQLDNEVECDDKTVSVLVHTLTPPRENRTEMVRMATRLEPAADRPPDLRAP